MYYKIKFPKIFIMTFKWDDRNETIKILLMDILKSFDLWFFSYKYKKIRFFLYYSSNFVFSRKRVIWMSLCKPYNKCDKSINTRIIKLENIYLILFY